MSSIPYDLLKQTTVDFFISKQVWTRITHVNTTMSFYAQPMKYRDIVGLVAKPDAKLPIEEVFLHKIVVCKVLNSNEFVRAKILYTNGIKCDLFAIDFGFMLKSIPVQDLFKPLYDIPILPLAVHCQLANCNFIESGAANIAATNFCEYLYDKKLKLTVVGVMHGKYSVRVANNFIMQDVVGLLSLTDHHAVIVNEINRISCRPPVENFFHHKSYAVGNKLEVKFLSGDSLEMFYVADLNNYESNNLFINKIYNQDLYDLEQSQLQKEFPVSVFSKKSNRYNRGLIKELNLNQQTAMIYYVDEGRIEKARWMDLREVPNELFSVQAMAIKCGVNKNQFYDHHYQKYLKPAQTFFITLIQPAKPENDFNLVLLSDT